MVSRYSIEEPDKMLMPNTYNNHIDLEGFEDPLLLAVVVTRDPDSLMSIAAVANSVGRESPVMEVFNMLENLKHPVVKQCVDFAI